MRMSRKRKTAASPADGLEKWMQDYRASVGESAQMCVPLMRELQQPDILSAGGQAQLLDLLTILNSLSPDPITVSCAMLLALEQSGGEVARIR